MSNQLILPIELINHILSFRATHPIISDHFKLIMKLYNNQNYLGYETFDRLMLHHINHKNKEYYYRYINGIYKKILIQ